MDKFNEHRFKKKEQPPLKACINLHAILTNTNRKM